jgi:Cdc6-like AAA superfamily ATPase
MPTEGELLQVYNTQIVREMGVEKIGLSELFELCSHLNECDIVEVRDKNVDTKGGRKSSISPNVLSKKRVGGKSIGKNFYVELKIDLDELDEALEVAAGQDEE